MHSGDLEQDDGDNDDEVSEKGNTSAVADSKKDTTGSGGDSGGEAEEGESAGKLDAAYISELDGKSTFSS